MKIHPVPIQVQSREVALIYLVTLLGQPVMAFECEEHAIEFINNEEKREEAKIIETEKPEVKRGRPRKNPEAVQ